MERLDYYDILPEGMDKYLSYYGWHFSKKMCEWAVHNMIDRNGKPLVMADKESVEDMLKQHNVKLSNNKGYDAVFVYHMGKSDYLGSSIVDESKMVSKNCFERLDAMIRVYETARMRFKDDKVLLSLLRYQKLPSVALGCVDKLLSEGFGSSAIKKQMSVKGYDKYIDYSADTPYDLKMKIITWKLLPFAYKP